MFYSAGQTAPQLEGTAYIADGARIIGGVHLGAEANIRYNASNAVCSCSSTKEDEA